MVNFPRGEKYKKFGIRIGSGCRIWGKIDTHFGKCVSIGNNVVLGGESMILTHCPIKGISEKSMEIKISDNVWIGYRSIILPGTKIHPRTIIGAGSIVSGEICSDSIYAGSPARFIKKRTKREIVRLYLLITQDLIGSIPTVKPKWNILKEDLCELFNLSEKEYTQEYDNLRIETSNLE